MFALIWILEFAPSFFIALAGIHMGNAGGTALGLGGVWLSVLEFVAGVLILAACESAVLLAAKLRKGNK